MPYYLFKETPYNIHKANTNFNKYTSKSLNTKWEKHFIYNTDIRLWKIPLRLGNTYRKATNIFQLDNIITLQKVEINNPQILFYQKNFFTLDIVILIS